MLRAVDVHKTYRDGPVFEDLTLEVGGGDIVAVVGPNGAGKSTLLDCLAGAAPLDKGSITIADESSDPSSASHWRAVFGILDDFGWLPDLTVADHLMLLSPARDPLIVRKALASFGVEQVGDRLPDSLSAGQLQRAALATARVRPWRVLLLDEPERHLDTEGVEILARELRGMVTPDRCAVLSSHSSALLDLLDCRIMPLVDREPD